MVLIDKEEAERYNQIILILRTKCYGRGKYTILPIRTQKEGFINDSNYLLLLKTTIFMLPQVLRDRNSGMA